MRVKRYFVIYSQSETEQSNDAAYWSNKDGWGALSSATVFERKETRQVDLPMSHHGDAEWKELPVCMTHDPRWVKEEEEEGC